MVLRTKEFTGILMTSREWLYDDPNGIGGSHEIHFSWLLFTRKWSLGLLNTQAFF